MSALTLWCFQTHDPLKWTNRRTSTLTSSALNELQCSVSSPEQEPHRGLGGVAEQDQVLLAHRGDGRPAAAGGEEAGDVPAAQTGPPSGQRREDRSPIDFMYAISSVSAAAHQPDVVSTDVRQRLGKRRYSPDRERSPPPVAPRDAPAAREPIRDVHRRLGVAGQDSRGLYSNTSKDRKTGTEL